MKTKTFVILLAIFVIVLAVGGLMVYQKTRPGASLKMGAPMIPEIPAGEIAAIRIRSPEENIELVNGNKGWVVQTAYQYPADFSRIRELVDALKDAKIGRSFDAGEEIRNRLALVSPVETAAVKEKQGTLIELKNDKGALIAGILLGETRKRGGEGDVPDGQYVMLEGSQKVYLVDKIFTSFETEPSSWLAKNPVRINSGDIAKISCTGPEGIRYVLERNARGGEFKLAAPSSEQDMDRAAINRLSDALSSFRIEDVRPRTSGGKSPQSSETSEPIENAGTSPSEKVYSIDYTLFDGLAYHVRPDPACSEQGPCNLKIDVSWNESEWKKEDKGKEKSAAKTGKAEEKTPADLLAEAAKENDRLRPWVFVVPKWRHDAFTTDFQKLLKQDKEEKKG